MAAPKLTWKRRYASGLRAEGLAAEDVRALVAMAERTAAPYVREDTLIPFVLARVSGATMVLDGVVRAQAHGPRGLFADPWRLLFVEGCPLDHIWATLWHSFKDPKADPQDEVWLPKRVGLENVRRYIALRFPRSGAPAEFGPGLGCETLLANARGSFRELQRLQARFPDSPTVIMKLLNHARSALTPAARAEVDLQAKIAPQDVLRWPSAKAEAELRARIGAKTLAIEELSAAELAFLHSPPGWDDLVKSEDTGVVGRWFGALDGMLTSGKIVFDAAWDRYRLASEDAATAHSIRRRVPPSPARPHPARCRTLVEAWSRRSRRMAKTGDYFGDRVTLQDLDSRDPLRWLHGAAEMAAFVRYDFESHRTELVPPRGH